MPVDINSHAKNKDVIVTKKISRRIKHKFHISYPKYCNVHSSISKSSKIHSTVIKYKKVVKTIKSKLKDVIKDIKYNVFKSTNRSKIPIPHKIKYTKTLKYTKKLISKYKINILMINKIKLKIKILKMIEGNQSLRKK